MFIYQAREFIEEVRPGQLNVIKKRESAPIYKS